MVVQGQMITAHRRHANKVLFHWWSRYMAKKVMGCIGTVSEKIVTMETGRNKVAISHLPEHAVGPSCLCRRMLANFYTQVKFAPTQHAVRSTAWHHGRYFNQKNKKLALKPWSFGDPMDMETQVGALISKDHMHKVPVNIQAQKTRVQPCFVAVTKSLKMGLRQRRVLLPPNGLYWLHRRYAPKSQDEDLRPECSVLSFQNDEIEVIKRARNT